MRIVSLTCSNTEIVCALGCSDLLVGVDAHSDYPVDVVGRLPRVGPDLQIDIEAVAALRPDLVLASLTVPGHEAVVAGLDAAGLPWIAPEPVSLEDVYRDIRDIGARIGRSDAAEALVAEMRAAMPAVEAQARPSILVEWWPKPVIVPGKQSWVSDLIALAGGRNPLSAEDCKSRPVTDAEVVAWSPDASVICWCGVPYERYRVDVVTRREAWQGLPVLEQVHTIPEAFLGRPGPRLVQGYNALRRVIEAVVERR